MKSVDLSLFRTASNARKVHVTQTGGDVYIVAGVPSEMSVLWGEMFGAKERKFMRELMVSQEICFSLRDTYQIFIRCAWHTASLGVPGADGRRDPLRKQGRFALLLHDLVGNLTTSWCWGKFVRPLYRYGFSVLVPDLPGFGKSSVAQDCSCPVSRWQPQQSHVIAKIMEELSVTKCHILATGHTCGILLNVLQSAPHRLCGFHVLINPVFDRMALFDHVGIDPPPGAKAGWREVIKQKQMTALVDLLRTTGVRLWCIFDRETRYRGLNELKGKPPSKALQRDWDMASDTFEMLSMASKNEFVAVNLKVTEITKNDLCEASAGKKIPTSLLVPSRHLKASVARFLADYEKKPWEHLFTPNHMSFGKKTGGAADDDDDEDNVVGSVPKAFAEKHDHLGHRHDDLALLPSRQGMASSSSLPALAVKNIPSREEREAADDSRMNQISQHSLSAAAKVAGQQLRSTGSSALGGKKVENYNNNTQLSMNWTKVPFEGDLSYGVRKMFLDAFEASVDTFKDEQQKEYDLAVAFKARTAMRAAHQH